MLYIDCVSLLGNRRAWPAFSPVIFPFTVVAPVIFLLVSHGVSGLPENNATHERLSSASNFSGCGLRHAGRAPSPSWVKVTVPATPEVPVSTTTASFFEANTATERRPDAARRPAEARQAHRPEQPHERAVRRRVKVEAAIFIEQLKK